MNDPTLNALTQRLDRVERENRWWKVIGSIALVMLVLVLLLGAATAKVPDEIRARRFELVDQNGKLRGVLRVDPDGSPVLVLLGDDHVQASLRVAARHGWAMLDLVPKDRTGSISLTAWSDGYSRLNVSRGDPREGVVGVMVGILPNVTPGFAIRKDGKVIWKAP